jgi:hypothetical protein
VSASTSIAVDVTDAPSSGEARTSTSPTTVVSTDAASTTAASTTAVATTAVPTTEAQTTTTSAPAAPPEVAPLRLGLTGLGSSSFGDAAQGSETSLVSQLGPPNADTGWVSYGDEFDACVWSQRELTWPDIVVVFMDFGSGPYLSGYMYEPQRRNPVLRVVNETGLEIGDSDGDILAAYPFAYIIYDEPSYFDTDQGLMGKLSVVAETGPNAATVQSLIVGTVGCAE